jgi:formylglycine-generating enzyme
MKPDIFFNKLSHIAVITVMVYCFFSCKTTKEPERVYAHYNPTFNQMNKEYVRTPSSKQAKLDTLVQILSNLRDELLERNETLVFNDELDLVKGELIIDIDLINEKPPIFDTFMVVNDYLFRGELFDRLFPVIPDSVRFELLMLADSAMSIAPDSTLTLTPDSIVTSTNELQILSANQDSIVFDSLKIKPNQYYTFDDVLADSTRDLLDADLIIKDFLKTVPWKTNDSIPYYKGYSNFIQDSMIQLITTQVYVEIHDPSRDVKQYPKNQLSNDIPYKHTIQNKFVHRDKFVFKMFYKDQRDVFIKMVRVTGGEFKIGSNEYDEDERPEYNLKVSSFLLSKFEVTNDIFCDFLNYVKADSLGYLNRTRIYDIKSKYSKIVYDTYTDHFYVLKGWEDYPVVNVTWAGASKFCLSLGGRLPTEAEWEYAAKGGVFAIRYYTNLDKTDYAYEHRYAGSNMMGGVGWFVDNSDGYYQPVGQLNPNLLGLHDMCGNVWEWCDDNYDAEFYKRNSKGTNPVNYNGNGMRINRGGSWSSDAIYCRITNRNYFQEFQTSPYLGFRYYRER